MIQWKKIEAGHYASLDKRFVITKDYDRIYGDHWSLQDTASIDRYKGKYHEKSLLDCKLKAESLKEKGVRR